MEGRGRKEGRGGEGGERREGNREGRRGEGREGRGGEGGEGREGKRERGEKREERGGLSGNVAEEAFCLKSAHVYGSDMAKSSDGKWLYSDVLRCAGVCYSSRATLCIRTTYAVVRCLSVCHIRAMCRNGYIYAHGMRIGKHTQSFEWYHFK